MDVVKLGKKGQVSLPASVLRKLGLKGPATFVVEATPDGALLLRPVRVYPVESYSEARLQEFAKADRMTPAESARLARALKRRKR